MQAPVASQSVALHVPLSGLQVVVQQRVPEPATPQTLLTH
jgi:hypothetical protein